jgi:hypothetical protein
VAPRNKIRNCYLLSPNLWPRESRPDDLRRAQTQHAATGLDRHLNAGDCRRNLLHVADDLAPIIELGNDARRARTARKMPDHAANTAARLNFGSFRDSVFFEFFETPRCADLPQCQAVHILFAFKSHANVLKTAALQKS